MKWSVTTFTCPFRYKSESDRSQSSHNSDQSYSSPQKTFSTPAVTPSYRHNSESPFFSSKEHSTNFLYIHESCSVFLVCLIQDKVIGPHSSSDLRPYFHLIQLYGNFKTIIVFTINFMGMKCTQDTTIVKSASRVVYIFAYIQDEKRNGLSSCKINSRGVNSFVNHTNNTYMQGSTFVKSSGQDEFPSKTLI